MNSESPRDSLLFWGCFIALIATAFGFIVRAQIIGEWGEEFDLTPTQQGEIFGVGLWPFAISIVVFSLIIDKIGYKFAMIFGFLCHVLSVVITVNARGYNSLYWGTFIVALGNGTVEAYINPVVATMYNREKTKWLNILHAAWPGGLVLGGVLAVSMGDRSWKLKVLLLLIPTVTYFLLLIGKTFPVNERVAAGVSYRDMLKEVGALGIFIIAWMIFAELARVFGWSETPLRLGAIIAGAIGLGFGIYVGSLGRPMFVLMLIIMVPLATTELGVDSWVTELMVPAMGKWAPWLLIYTSAIMVVLRFWFAGPIVNRLTPLGTLATCALLAAIGLAALSKAEGAAMIIIAATIYGVGKTFFWPTTLGVVAEQFPRGGAMTLNGISGVGMLGVGVLGAMFLGNIQDNTVDAKLSAEAPAIHQAVAIEKQGLLGSYQSIDTSKVEELSAADQEIVEHVQNDSKKSALMTVAIFPVLMLISYLGLMFYFSSKGGYRPVMIEGVPAAH